MSAPGAPLLLSDAEARRIVALLERGETKIEVPADLGFSRATAALDFAADAPFPGLTRERLAHLASLRERVFAFGPGAEARAVETAGPPYVKLVPTAGAPTMQIDGVKMHRTEGIDPIADTERKLARIVRRADRVLDTCAGLGYTAIRAALLGARFVLSIERSGEVLQIARHNPWSAAWFAHPAILRVRGDAAELAELLPDRAFDAVIHDPPRFSLAGELYSDRFYRTLARILAPRGRLFHYVGKPDSAYGARLFPSIERRLSQAGFAVKLDRDNYGFTATAR